MTRKDYELIARVLRESHEDIARSFGDRGQHEHNTIDELTARFAEELAFDNPRFDRARFIAATSWEDQTC